MIARNPEGREVSIGEVLGPVSGVGVKRAILLDPGGIQISDRVFATVAAARAALVAEFFSLQGASPASSPPLQATAAVSSPDPASPPEAATVRPVPSEAASRVVAASEGQDHRIGRPFIPCEGTRIGEYTTADYRIAPSGEGPLAGQWADKPHRLVYDLCGEAERLAARDGTLELAMLGETLDRIGVPDGPGGLAWRLGWLEGRGLR